MDRSTHNSTAAQRQQSKIARRARRFIAWSVQLFLLVCCAFTVAAAPRFVPGRILVKPRPAVSETNLVGKLHARGATAHRTLHRLNIRVVDLPEARAEAALAELRGDPDIEFAERDYIAEAAFVPADPLVTSGTEWHLARIQADLAWNITTGRTNVIVALLDSGVNATHPDLAGQLLPGYDFVFNDSDPADDFGHGTAVAGTVAAAGNNNSGVAGVAFGCRVLPVKVMDSSGFAFYSTIAQGIRYAVDRGARVINISIAGGSSSSTLQDAINYAWSNNVIVVAAAGNGANNIPMYPAACDHVVAVSATEPDDSLAWFSNYGNHIALAAPGASIWTTQRDPANPYGPWRGTSFASPVVAAVAALVASANPSLTNNEIISVLEQSADDLGAAGIDAMFGYGRVNAAKAVAVASALPGALLVQPPPDLNTNQIVRVDVFAPSIAVTTSPANGARLSSPIVAFAGIASDDSGVNRVELQLNADSFQTVVGTSDWNASIVLAPGANTVRIRSIDSAGNVSPEITFTLTYVLNTPLAVRIDGAGSVTPNLDGKWLEIGRNYSMKAVPDRGQAFAGWSGVSSPSALLNFTMQSNLVLTAHFVPSPFPAVKGTYTGLVAETNRIAPESSGFFRLNVTPGGAFTGKLALGGKRHGFHGRFDLSGNATIHVNRRLLNPITIALHVDLTNVADAVEGSVTDGGWSSVLSGDRNVFNAKLNPASQAGLRAFILERADDTAITAATGASAISSGGAARVKGLLNDGRAFSTASVLARNGDCPFYLSLNRGSEVVIGWLNFPASSSPTASGEVLWVRTGTNAFAATLQATSAP